MLASAESFLSLSKSDLIKGFGASASDTGSPEVQIVIFSQRIKQISDHLRINPKDFSGRHGLMILIGRRNRLLSYLKRVSLERHAAVVKKIGLKG